jgi:hypothetical protein
MFAQALRRALTTAATLTVLTLPAVCGAAIALPPDPDGPPRPEPSSTGPGPVWDDGTWTIETMLADRHALLTTRWWESLF